MTSEKRTVLVCVDGSEESEKALKWYVDKLHHPGNKVYVVTCVEHRNHITYGTVWMPIDPHLVIQAYQEEDRRANAVMEKHKEMLKETSVDAECLKVMGDPGHRICDVAKEKDVDYIVTGCRGLGTVRRTILGSVSDFIVHHSHIPVLIWKKKHMH